MIDAWNWDDIKLTVTKCQTKHEFDSDMITNTPFTNLGYLESNAVEKLLMLFFYHLSLAENRNSFHFQKEETLNVWGIPVFVFKTMPKSVYSFSLTISGT